MLEKQPISEQRIVDCLIADYGIDVSTLTFLPLGADMHASVYKAQARDKSAYFIKIKRSHGPDVSSLIIDHLQDAGIKQVIPILKTIHNHPTQRIGEFTLSVSPFIEGQDGFSRSLTDDQWVTFGKTLKKVHEIEVPPPLHTKLRRESYSPQWRETVRSLYAHIESEPRGDEVAVQLQTFMKQRIALIHQLVERAEQLAQKLQTESPEFVLCHSDIHGGNLLMDGNDAIYMVDWDAPIMAPKERDLMFIGGAVANVWNQPREEELFYKGYGKAEVNMEILAYYRHERIVEDIASYGQQLLLTTAGGQDRIEAYKHFVAQFEPQGVVEIAFKTDDDQIFEIGTKL
ncbi:MAG: aminoglycoside phosphotransferase family protein [Alphaproteobacteria bacterium]